MHVETPETSQEGEARKHTRDTNGCDPQDRSDRIGSNRRWKEERKGGADTNQRRPRNRTKDAFYTVLANERFEFDDLEVINDVVCTQVRQLVDVENVEVLHRALVLDRMLACGAQVDVAHLANRALDQLEGRKTNLRWLRPTMDVLLELHQKAGELPQDVVNGFADTVAGLIDLLDSKEGTFQNGVNNAGLAYHIFADAVDMKFPSMKPVVRKSAKSIPQLFQHLAATSKTFTIVPPGDARDGELGSLIAAANLLSGASRLLAIDGKGDPLDLEIMTAMAGYLLGEKNVGTPEAAYYLGEAIQAMKAGVLPKPLLVFLELEPEDGADARTVYVASLTGRLEEDCKVTVESISRDGKVLPKFKAMTLSRSEEGGYPLRMPVAAGTMGLYEVAIKVESTARKGKAARNAVFNTCVRGGLKADGLSVQVIPAKKESLDYPPANLEWMQAPEDVELSNGQGLAIRTTAVDAETGKPFSPKQVLLALTDSVSGRSTHHALEKKEHGKYEVSISNALLDKDKPGSSGRLTADLIVGDLCAFETVRWNFATIRMGEVTAEKPVGKAGWDHSKKPDIVHMERPAEKIPPSILPAVFVGLALAPMLGLAVLLSKLGLEYSGLPKDFKAKMLAAGFHGGVLSILLLYVVFWLVLDLKQTMPVLLLLLAWTVLFGKLYLKGKGPNKEKTA